MKIEWALPEFRKGWKGQVDRFIGPGATKAELNLQLYIPLMATIIIIGLGLYHGYNWTWRQYAVAAFLGIDMIGGIATNLTSAAKRWNFREGNGFKQHMLFLGLHLVQLSLVSMFFLNIDLLWIGTLYGYLMLSTAFIFVWPLYLQRPVAGLIFALSLVLSIYVFKSPEHLEWFLPLFFFKLQISHAVREEPYRPES